MLGAGSPQRYLLLIQNNAESRATGGIPGALAVLTVDRGKLSLGEQTSAGDLGTMVPVVQVDPEQERIFTPRLGKFMQDVNLTPDFPTSAGTAQAMWKRKTGETLDGVISVDPVFLSYLLNATGPVKLSSSLIPALVGTSLPSELTGQNVVQTLLSDVYSEINEPARQDLYFAGVARAIFAALSDGNSDPQHLLDGIVTGVDEGRVLLWSRTPGQQAVIAKYPISGSISGPSTSPAEFGVYFNDGTGAKMDFYVKRKVELFKVCTNDEYSEIKVRVTSTNTAPRDANISLPEYVTGGGVFGVKAGTVQTNISAYGPVQSHIERASQNGVKIPFNSQQHDGRPVGTLTVSLTPGQTKAVEVTFSKIVQHTEPKLTVTPTVQPVRDVAVTPNTSSCGEGKE